jgi:hypothetical protein
MKATAPRPEHARLIAEIEAFLIVRRMAQSTFSRFAMGDPLFVADVRKGRRLFVATENQVRAFMIYVCGGGDPALWLASLKRKETPRSAPPGLAARSGGGGDCPPSHPRRRQSPA